MDPAFAPSPPAVRFAAFDLDGTLLDAQGQLRPRLTDRLAELATSGLAPLVASGRAVRSFRELPLAALASPLLADEVLLGDGAVLFRRSTGRVTALRRLPASTLRALFDAGARDVVAEVGAELVASSRRAALLYARMYALARSVVVVDARPADAPGPVTAATVFDAPEHLARRLAVRHDTDRVGPFAALLVRPRGTCKATGLAAHLADRAGRPGLDSVAAFGDAFNDACLLASCRLGVAVAAADETAARCAHVRLDQPLSDFLSGFDPDRAALMSRATAPRRPGAAPCSGAHRRPEPGVRTRARTSICAPDVPEDGTPRPWPWTTTAIARPPKERKPTVHERTAHDAPTEPAAAEPVRRPTVRVLLLDEDDRLLLFSSHDSEGRTFWYPAGGGVEDGETYEQAAEREVAEETGLTGLVPTAEVWRRHKIGPMGGVIYHFHERYYLARVPAFDISTDGFTESERTSIVGHRWWSPDELASTADRLVPDDLYPRLVDLLTAGVPAEPIDLTP